MIIRPSALTVPTAVLLLVVLVACGGESRPTPSPTAPSAPSPTPSLTATSAPSPAPSPTASPVPKSINVDPIENPAGFLQALPASERECLEQTVGSEKLEEFISSAEPAKETLQACLSEETIRSVIQGRMSTEAEQEACVVEAIGEQAGREVFSGQRAPSSDELDALAGCGIGTSNLSPVSELPDFYTLPEASAPAELGTVDWPYNIQESSALFGRLPSEIAGYGIRTRFDRSGPNRFDTTYGEDPQTHGHVLWATVQDLAEGDFEVGWEK